MISRDRSKKELNGIELLFGERWGNCVISTFQKVVKHLLKALYRHAHGSAKDGSKRYTTEIVAKNVQFIGGRADAGAGQGMNQDHGHGSFDQSQGQSNTNSSMIDQDYSIPQDSNFTADDIPF